MSGLLFLNSDDFYIAKGTKGNILCHSIPGFSLILFYSTQCVHCQNLIPIFKKLPGSIGGCQFGMINVSTNKSCVQMSRDTIAPITFVPYIILYINSRPFMRYQGPHDLNEIKRFVFEISQKMESRQKFSETDVKEDPRGGIPSYTIGHPLYGEDNVSYLEFNTAYVVDKSQKRSQRNDFLNMNDSKSMQQSLAQNYVNNR